MLKNSLAYILLLITIGVIVYLIANPRTITEIDIVYKEGKKDTLFVIDTIAINDTVFVFQSDTVEIDSKGSKSFTTAFNIPVDSLVRVKGEVGFKEPNFTFKDIEVTYPKVEITRVDTLEKTITIEKPRVFYDTFEVGFAIGVLLTTLASLLLGA